jgi:uncharacterized repeat protein (TIGR01451 family)
VGGNSGLDSRTHAANNAAPNERQNLLSNKISTRWLTPLRQGLLALGLTLVGVNGTAQVTSVGIGVASSPNPAGVGDSLTYTISLTNLFAPQVVFVTNTLPASVQFTGVATNLAIISTLATGHQTIFGIAFPTGSSGVIAQMTISGTPTATGTVRDTVDVAGTSFSTFSTTNIDTVVTNGTVLNTNQADLAVSISGPVQAVIANDWMTYEVTVANLGPNDAPNVLLTNTLPAGVGLINPSPSNLNGSNLVYRLDTLTNGTMFTVQITVQPTNTGTYLFPAGAGSDVTDPNPTNNSAGTNIVVTGYPTGQLQVASVSSQVLNLQNGWMEQTLSVANVGTNSVGSARLVVTGLTSSNRLVNAMGTNNGNPFVVYGAALDTNQSVELRLQYFSVTRAPLALGISPFQAYPVPAYNLAVPSNLGTQVTVTNPGIWLPGLEVLIEFPAITGRSYTVTYYDNGDTNHVRVAPPPVPATANWVQWIDFGPPGTLTAPSNVLQRSYMIFLDP